MTTVNRREFLGAMAALPATLEAKEKSKNQDPSATHGQSHPNVLLIIADQFRWDFVGAYGLNPVGVTPNLDGMARRGVAFQNAVTNQPVCAPSRSILFTGQYANQREYGRRVRDCVMTLATVFRSQGYTANYIGKWHLAFQTHKDPNTFGYVPPESRGGVLDLWQASNLLEFTSHPYEGTIWNRDGKPRIPTVQPRSGSAQAGEFGRQN